MFLNRLNRQQQEALLNLARDMVAADGVVSLGEISHSRMLREELGIPSDEATEVLSVSAAAARFNDRESRAIALIELIRLSHADGSFTPRENSLITRLCATWKVDGERLAELEEWARRYRELMREARSILFDS